MSKTSLSFSHPGPRDKAALREVRLWGKGARPVCPREAQRYALLPLSTAFDLRLPSSGPHIQAKETSETDSCPNPSRRPLFLLTSPRSPA